MSENTPPASSATPGRVKVANEVIAQIAALTALQVAGISGMADRTNQLTRVIRRGGIHKGVRLEMTGQRDLRLQLYVVAESGKNLPALAAEVQGRVASAVDRMLGLNTTAVDVHFADVRFAAPA
ncbi:MAG: Asp23/Gls24 family envelope stress response protein [Candidatus Dormibacteraeota bacterium]|nr:Asp23/Gls24 family envelope stress response protein [Candidatus Dormibacteraeota bacterium]